MGPSSNSPNLGAGSCVISSSLGFSPHSSVEDGCGVVAKIFEERDGVLGGTDPAGRRCGCRIWQGSIASASSHRQADGGVLP